MNEKSVARSQKLPIIIGITFLFWIGTMAVFLNYTNIRSTDFYSLYGKMSAEITQSNGEKKSFDSGNFERIKRGDVARMSVRLPREKGLGNAELLLPIPHCIINVYLEGSMIYKDDYDPKDVRAHYGNRVYEILLPADYEGKELVIELNCVVSIPYADLESIGIARANEGWRVLLENNSFVFVISMSMVVISLFGIFLFGVQSIITMRPREGLLISWFEFLIGSWFFCSMRFGYILTGNSDVSTKGEYFALYMAVIPLAIFIYMVVDKVIFKKIILALEIVYVVYYIVTLFIELSPAQVNYSDMLATMHPLAAVLLIVLMIALFFGIEKKASRHVNILRYGIVLAIICGIIELVRYNVGKYLINSAWISSYSASSLAILIIAASLIIYLVSYSAEEYTAQIESNQLMELAYKDPLTGLPNRNSCYEEIEKMDRQKICTYTMIFFDLNNLKLANDTYGHNMGDRLLNVAAGYIRDCFSENGFCARWGGDEFVACVYGEFDKAKEKMDYFEKLMRAEDASEDFPFPFSIARGYACSSEEEPLAPLDAIRQADAFMYENKVRMKCASA